MYDRKIVGLFRPTYEHNWTSRDKGQFKNVAFIQ